MALIVIPLQIRANDRLQQSLSARDTYRDSLNLTFQRPEIATTPPGPRAQGKTLVIGAGLAAARALHDARHDVTVLEGRDRIGGRIHTSRLWPDLPMDLGGSWIRRRKGNPPTELAQ